MSGKKWLNHLNVCYCSPCTSTNKMSSKHYQFLFSLFFFELMTCKIFFTVRVRIENLARSNLLTKEYFISAKERSDRRKRIFIKTISCHENYFIFIFFVGSIFLKMVSYIPSIITIIYF